MAPRRLVLKDTTFRDGIQGEGVEPTELGEVMRAIQAIDELGIAYHEVGFATASGIIKERIEAACRLKLQGKVCAFGRTHPLDVVTLMGLCVDHGLPVGVLVGKSRERDAKISLGKSTEENLAMIHNFVKDLVEAGLEVIYDAEHFFQAWFESEDDYNYAFATLKAAADAGASWLVLCDTNGKMTPAKIISAVKEVKERLPGVKLGIHTHNDRGRAVANAEAAFEAGVELVEGTIGGVGERTGNMDLCSFIPNAVFDLGAQEPLALEKLCQTYLLVCDVLNIAPRRDLPWVGSSAFYTEAGMHQCGLYRDPGSYFHANPVAVGNEARVGVTDQSGRANLVSKAREFGIEIPPNQLAEIAKAHQELVDEGANFGTADASLYLFLLRQLGRLPEFFRFVELELRSDIKPGAGVDSQAVLRLTIGDKKQLHVADGDGPVNAADEALRRTLRGFYPELDQIRLTDFKVRMVDARGSASKVRVLIDFTDGKKSWTTMGVSDNIEQAAWQALWDSYTYKLVVNGTSPLAL